MLASKRRAKVAQHCCKRQRAIKRARARIIERQSIRKIALQRVASTVERRARAGAGDQRIRARAHASERASERCAFNDDHATTSERRACERGDGDSRRQARARARVRLQSYGQPACGRSSMRVYRRVGAHDRISWRFVYRCEYKKEWPDRSLL